MPRHARCPIVPESSFTPLVEEGLRSGTEIVSSLYEIVAIAHRTSSNAHIVKILSVQSTSIVDLLSSSLSNPEITYPEIKENISMIVGFVKILNRISEDMKESTTIVEEFSSELTDPCSNVNAVLEKITTSDGDIFSRKPNYSSLSDGAHALLTSSESHRDSLYSSIANISLSCGEIIEVVDTILATTLNFSIDVKKVLDEKELPDNLDDFIAHLSVIGRLSLEVERAIYPQVKTVLHSAQSAVSSVMSLVQDLARFARAVHVSESYGIYREQI